MAPSITAPIGGRHYVPPITIGPIPGLAIREPKPKAPELTFAEELAAARAFEEQNPCPSTDIQDLPDEHSLCLDEYTGPAEAIPMPKVPWPSSMVGETSEGPCEVWKKICEEAARKRSALPKSEAQDLWVVFTGRPGKLMLLVCPESDLVSYLDGVSPCPVAISGANAFLTLTGEAQSLSGYARHGAAASTLGRLAHFDSERAATIKTIISLR